MPPDPDQGFADWLDNVHSKTHKNGLVTRERAALLKEALQWTEAQSSGSAGGSSDTGSAAATPVSSGSARPAGVTPAVLNDARANYVLVDGQLCRRVRGKGMERQLPLVCQEDVPATVQHWHETLKHAKSEALHTYIFTKVCTTLAEGPSGSARVIHGLACISRTVCEQYVNQWCANCATRRRMQKAQRPVVPITVMKKRVHWQMDLKDNGAHLTSCGMRYVLVVVDLFTKFAMLYALAKKHARGIAICLRDSFWRIGQPLKIQCDNGTEFAGDVAALCSEMGVRLVHGRPYHPWTQGKVERVNKLLVERLSAAVHDAPDFSWADLLADVEIAINATPTRTLGGMSPYQAEFGQPPNLPPRLQLTLGEEEDDGEPEDSDYLPYEDGSDDDWAPADGEGDDAAGSPAGSPADVDGASDPEVASPERRRATPTPSLPSPFPPSPPPSHPLVDRQVWKALQVGTEGQVDAMNAGAAHLGGLAWDNFCCAETALGFLDMEPYYGEAKQRVPEVDWHNVRWWLEEHGEFGGTSNGGKSDDGGSSGGSGDGSGSRNGGRDDIGDSGGGSSSVRDDSSGGGSGGGGDSTSSGGGTGGGDDSTCSGGSSDDSNQLQPPRPVLRTRRKKLQPLLSEEEEEEESDDESLLPLQQLAGRQPEPRPQRAAADKGRRYLRAQLNIEPPSSHAARASLLRSPSQAIAAAALVRLAASPSSDSLGAQQEGGDAPRAGIASASASDGAASGSGRLRVQRQAAALEQQVQAAHEKNRQRIARPGQPTAAAFVAGQAVLLSVPEQLRSTLDPRQLLCRVMRVEGLGSTAGARYIVHCKAGVLTEKVPGHQLHAAPSGSAGKVGFPESDKRYGKSSGVPQVTLRAAAAAQHVGGQGTRCRCGPAGCRTSTCACVRAKLPCGRHCSCSRSGGNCANYNE